MPIYPIYGSTTEEVLPTSNKLHHKKYDRRQGQARQANSWFPFAHASEGKKSSAIIALFPSFPLTIFRLHVWMDCSHNKKKTTFSSPLTLTQATLLFRCFDTVFRRPYRYSSIFNKLFYPCPIAIKFSPLNRYYYILSNNKQKTLKSIEAQFSEI